MSEKTNYLFNVKPSSLDDRDYRFKETDSQLREVVSLRHFDSPVEDQLTLGSCVSHATTSAYENLINQKNPELHEELSRLYHYYHVRHIESSVDKDRGVLQLRNAFKALKNYNICVEELWPYEIENFDVQPLPEAYADSKKRTIANYYHLRNTNEMIKALNVNYPVVVGMDIFESIMEVDSSDPKVKMPSEEDTSAGGHSVCLVGYSIPEKMFLAKNSFGLGWGDNGYFWIPFEYADNYIFDAWTFDIDDNHNHNFYCNDDYVAIKSASVPLTEIPNNNNNKEEIKMADVDTTMLSMQHADIRREAAEHASDIRREGAEHASDIRREAAEHTYGIRGDVKDANHNIITEVDRQADRLDNQASQFYIAGQTNATVAARDLATLTALTEANATAMRYEIALNVEKTAAASALAAEKVATAVALGQSQLSKEIFYDGQKTRDLINDLKYHDLNRALVERNTELVDERYGRRHWRHLADQNQFQGQWAQLQSQVQAFQSQLQETRQGMVNFGTMSGQAGQQTSTSNNVR